MIRVRASQAGWSPNFGSYVVLLQEIEGERYYPVFVDEMQAQMINILSSQISEEHYKTPRLCASLLRKLGGRISKIRIFKNFLSEVLAGVEFRAGSKTRKLIGLPGEAIELALRCGALIVIHENLLLGPDLPESNRGRFNDMEALRAELEKAVEFEEYEEAARLRDKIAVLEDRRHENSENVH